MMLEALDNLFADHRYRFVLIALLAMVIMFTKLGGNGIATWDDCFYAQKGKEILKTGSWMTMHYDGRPAFENPPFFMWLVAFSYMAWGTNEYGAVFPSALFGVLTVLLAYWVARQLFDEWVGFFSSLVLSTTFYFTKYARHAMIDVTLSFFVTLALFALVLALRRNKRYLILWGIAIGISILLKSILGFFPLVISIVFLIATKRWEIFYNLWFLVGGVIALGVGCSWYVHQYLFFGSPFLDVHFGWLILDRGFGGTPEPWYAHLSFLRDLLRHYWPWFPVFALGLYQFLRMALQKDENALLLVSWSLITLGVMSLTHQRILWYVMPVFPAAAIICGFVINGWLSETGRLKTIRWIAMTGLGASLVMNLTPLQLSSQREVDIRTIAPLVRHLVPQGATLTAFRYTYHSLNNPLLFYSDHAARPIFQNMSDLREAFNSDEALVCVVKAEDLDSILREIPNTFVVKRTSGACLIANRHFDVSWARTL